MRRRRRRHTTNPVENEWSSPACRSMGSVALPDSHALWLPASNACATSEARCRRGNSRRNPRFEGLKLDSNEIALEDPSWGRQARRRLAARQQRSNTAPSSAPTPLVRHLTLDGPPVRWTYRPTQVRACPPRQRGGVDPRSYWSCPQHPTIAGARYSRRRRRSLLHTRERTSGYTHGTLLVVRDAMASSLVVGAAASTRSPHHQVSVKDVDFTGSDKSVLVLPVVTWCRTRRKLAEASMKHGGSTHPSGGALKAAAAAAAAGAATVVPADQRFLYFNNRRVGKRGVGFGGSLKSFRLFVDASLERGSSLESCETFADGVLASAKEFDIARIEIWGCGGRDARIAQEVEGGPGPHAPAKYTPFDHR